jgi:hypothetical protein
LATYRLYPATSGPGSSSGDNGSYTMGVTFQVTIIAQQLLGYWWWIADSSQQPGPFEFALWQVTGSLSGAAATFIPGTTVTSGSLALGWNLVLMPGNPPALTANQEYLAVIAVNASGGHTASYSATSDFFDTGPGAGGITSGPLSAYSSRSPGTNPDPANNGQMVFNSGGTDPTVNLPASTFGAANYWLDVQVGVPAPAPPPVVYSMRTFP